VKIILHSMVVITVLLNINLAHRGLKGWIGTVIGTHNEEKTAVGGVPILGDGSSN